MPPTPDEQQEKPQEEAREEPPTPRVVKVRKPRTKTTAPTIAIPEIDDKFWANLLRTQREAEHRTKLQRISEFSLI